MRPKDNRGRHGPKERVVADIDITAFSFLHILLQTRCRSQVKFAAANRMVLLVTNQGLTKFM